jgi:hypothetical protein
VLAPLPVQIQSCHISPGHAVNDSIRVDHGDDVKLEIFQQVVAHRFCFGQLLYDGLGDERSHSFAWVLPSQNEDDLFFGLFFLVEMNQRYNIIGNRVADCFDFHYSELGTSYMSFLAVLGLERRLTSLE